MTEEYYIAISGPDSQQRIAIPRAIAALLKSHPGDYVQVKLTLKTSKGGD